MTKRLLLSVFLLAGTTAAQGADLYVAVDGNDAWSGRLAAANAAKTDGPFATLGRARDETRKLKAAEAVTIHVRGGRHVLAQPLELTPEDSGSKDRPISYCAYEQEKPVISGGVAVTNWRKHNDRLWAADVPWVRERGRPFYQLFVDGIRRPRARTPNAGSYFYTKRLQLTNAAFPVCLGMAYADNDIGHWKNMDDAVVVLFHNWVNSFNYLGPIDRDRRRVTFARPAGIFFLGPRVRYYVENVFEALDAPGEWFLDAAKGTLYYYPLPGEDMARAEVIAPRLGPMLVSVRGDAAAGRTVEHLTFRGLSFQHTDANLARDYPHSVQGAHTQRGAIFAVGLRNSVVERCEFAHLGEHAVSLREGCQSNAVRQCHIFDMGGGGVYLSEAAPPKPDDAHLTTRTVVDNNFIHDGGHLFRAACGVFLGGAASFNEITHNEVCDMSWMGVHLGWSWTGRAPAYTHHNTVAYNHLHHLGNGVLNDIGGIYTLGVSPGTVLHHNLIHDVTRFERGSEGYGGWGIYLDAGSSEIRVENNVVYNTRDGGLHVHCYGHPYSDRIVNNVFAFSDDAQMIRNAFDEPDGNHVHVERNIVYNRNAKMLGGANWKDGSKFTADRNCYWSETANPPDLWGRAFADWQKAGRDVNSIIADPGFVDAGQFDFRLKPNSPALKLGFQPIDISTAGLHGPAEWRDLPRGVEHRIVERPPTSLMDGLGPVVEDFEDYEPGESPAGAVAKEGDAAATVSDQDPARGRRCLRFVDAAGVTAWKPHWFAQRKPGAGKVRMQCSVKNDRAQPATIELEFRDWHGGSQPGDKYLTGPHVRFLPDGTVQAMGDAAKPAWVVVGKYEPGRWLQVEIEFAEGAGQAKTYTVRLTGPDGAATVTQGLPFRQPEFTLCTWAGFCGLDTKPAVFYVDDFRLE